VLYDFGIVSSGNRIELARFGRIDEIEQRWKGMTEAEAPAAAMADIEDALELRIKRGLVVKLVGPPVERMPNRRVEAAFAC
jgi:hypothetical protein